MRQLRFLALATTVGSLLCALAVAPVAGFEVDGGCNVTLTSTDADGNTLDTASGPGSGGTQADPFMIDWDGEVSWTASSGSTVFMNHSWQTYVFLVPIPVRGGDENEGGDTTGEGSAGVSANAPFRFTGLYYVSGEINGDEGAHCDGNGWFQLVGDPLGTVPFFIALGLILTGLAILAFSRPTVITGGRA